ncbi:MAG: SMI1/KNR4 family protein [Phycisphaerales bacterium]|nr:SMI1/KNR4 family protein [Phycisphaerales bacterium]
MSAPWSERFERDLSVRLSADLVEWFDRCLFESQDPIQLGEFAIPTIPDCVFDLSSSTIWAGLMLPDTIPVLENGCGDVVAMRIGKDGTVTEFIAWSHETCCWLPYGRSLPEAILSDLAKTRLEISPDEYTDEASIDRPVEVWALEYVRRATSQSFHWPEFNVINRSSALRALVAAGISEAFAQRELCLLDLKVELVEKLRYLKEHELLCELLSRCTIGPNLWFGSPPLSREELDRLIGVLGQPIEPLIAQNWLEAASRAHQILQIRTDLGWPFIVAGRAAERQQDLSGAAKHYLAALRTLGTNTPFAGLDDRHFILGRLRDLQGHYSTDDVPPPFAGGLAADEGSRGTCERVRRYWLQMAERAESSGQYELAYDCYYRLGWDQHCFDDMDQILDGLIRSAESAGLIALAKVAELHRRFMSTPIKMAEGAEKFLRRPSFLRRLFSKWFAG